MKSANRRKAQPFTNARIDYFHPMTTSAGKSDPRAWIPPPPPPVASPSPPLPAPAPDFSWRSRTESISWKSSIVLPPPPPRKATDTDSSNHQRQCLRWKGLPVPPPPPSTTNIASSVHQTARVLPNRTESTQATRTRTQQRRDRAKIARIRKFESYNRALWAAKERSHLRFEKQTHAGDQLPSTGVASIRRKQKANNMERRLAESSQYANL